MALTSGFFDGLSSAAGSLFGGIGDLKEADAYKKAASLAANNAQIAAESTQIQETQAQRKIFQTIGAQQAEVASAGFAASGSNLDLLHSSISQGSLQKQLIGEQGLIQQNSFLEEAAADQGKAAAAKAAAGGGFLSSIFKVASSFIGLSDMDAKQNITKIGPSTIPGINLYLFQYKGQTTVYKGVLAQEVQGVRPDAVIVTNGYLEVDYGKLGLSMEEVG